MLLTRHMPAVPGCAWQTGPRLLVVTVALAAVGGTSAQASPPEPGAFAVSAASPSSDTCYTTENGACITDGPGDYGNGERCTITVLRSTRLVVQSLSVQAGNDYFRVNNTGTRRDTANELTGLFLRAGSTLDWRTNGGNRQAGWVICAAGSCAPEAAGAVFRVGGSWPLRACMGSGGPSTAAEGTCYVTGGGRCVTDGPNNYGNNERCTIDVLQTTRLVVRSLGVQSGDDNDYFRVNDTGAQLDTQGELDSVLVEGGSTLDWQTDGGTRRAGWEICAAGLCAARAAGAVFEVTAASPVQHCVGGGGPSNGTEGTCFVTAGGTCVENNPAATGAQQCTVRVLRSATIVVRQSDGHVSNTISVDNNVAVAVFAFPATNVTNATTLRWNSVSGGGFFRLCAETEAPTVSPSEAPTISPSGGPTDSPSGRPTGVPTSMGPTTLSPTTSPSSALPTTSSPSEAPTVSSSGGPTVSPSGRPSGVPASMGPATLSPTTSPSSALLTTSSPTASPTLPPPTPPPSAQVTVNPTTAPSPPPSAGTSASEEGDGGGGMGTMIIVISAVVVVAWLVGLVVVVRYRGKRRSQGAPISKQVATVNPTFSARSNGSNGLPPRRGTAPPNLRRGAAKGARAASAKAEDHSYVAEPVDYTVPSVIATGAKNASAAPAPAEPVDYTVPTNVGTSRQPTPSASSSPRRATVWIDPTEEHMYADPDANDGSAA